MKIQERDAVNEILNEDDAVSLCSMFAGSESFGIDTRKIREVLGNRDLQRVPMAPAFIGGVVPYRGEVLTTVDFRALLGMGEHTEATCVLVLEDEDGEERFGLVVDAVGDLFGVTLAGGSRTSGTLYEIAAGTTAVKILHSFTAGRMGQIQAGR